MDLLTVAVAVALGATLYAFVSGVSAMAVDGEVRHHGSLEWMVRRVAFQAVAAALVVLAVLS